MLQVSAASDGRRPLMVGSERDYELDPNDPQNRSPSPHSRVGTYYIWNPLSRWMLSPSPHGRVGTTIHTIGAGGVQRRHRPLMVGSEPRLSGRSPNFWLGRRPLMVGSEQFMRECGYEDYQVAVPSWSGRNQDEIGQACADPLVAVPSWSGRNLSVWRRGFATSWSRRPLMVGSELFGGVLHLWSKADVAVPSWSGRNRLLVLRWSVEFQHRRPLMVGSEQLVKGTKSASLPSRRPLMVGSERGCAS